MSLPILDLPTLVVISSTISALIGFSLLFVWLRDPGMGALAWWGAAYLSGSAAMALWHLSLPIPAATPGALLLLACGMVWGGMRVFYRRGVSPLAVCAGAAAWIAAVHLVDNAGQRMIVAVAIVAAYAFCTTIELRRDRRRSTDGRFRKIALPIMHVAVFLLPLGFNIVSANASGVEETTRLFALETLIYAVGIAFIVLLAVKDRQIQIHKTAAETDPLTGLYNRRAFFLAANDLRERALRRGEPVSLMMFDLDKFKAINDRFGHAVGDEVIARFAATISSSLRDTDLVGRLGGEEFAAIVPGGRDVAAVIGERVRTNFEVAGVQFRDLRIEATVSIGAASSAAIPDIGVLMERADAALYRAKNTGRNRIVLADDLPLHPVTKHIAVARAANSLAVVR